MSVPSFKATIEQAELARLFAGGTARQIPADPARPITLTENGYELYLHRFAAIAEPSPVTPAWTIAERWVNRCIVGKGAWYARGYVTADGAFVPPKLICPDHPDVYTVLNPGPGCDPDPALLSAEDIGRDMIPCLVPPINELKRAP